MPVSIANTFYTAFQNNDTNTMVSLYHDNATFEDPAFGKLNAAQARAMWQMLLERSKGELKVTFNVIEESATQATCHWEAIYKFGPKKRPIHNKITARFKFEDGKIIEHIDEFNFWKWSGMALGTSGWLLGFTPIVKNKVRQTVKKLLKSYMQEKAK
ncbi:MAG: nuclear transport factor 2 family protein [Cyclobacteriaceae bacterium]